MTDDPRAEVGVCLLDASSAILDLDPDFARIARVGSAAAARGRPLAQVLANAPPLPSNEPTHVRLDDAGEHVELICRRCVGGPVAYTLTARTVRAESTLASQLRVARQTLDSVINASPLAILTVDRDKRVVMWNPAAERIFGWSQAEILGQPYPIVPDDERVEFERLFEQVVFQGQGFTGVEARRQRKDGSPVELRMHTAPLRDATGRVIGGMALLEDLTEKRQLEDRIRHSQKMEAVGRLAGGIAHDFNNLLTVVLGSGELLQLDTQLSRGASERVAEILAVAQSARDLVAKLMTFSRRQVTRPEVVDLNCRLREASRMLERLLNPTVELRISTCVETARVRIDPTQLDRILVNLTINAGDAMPKGGVLTLRTSIVGRAEESSEHQVCLEARDNGTGIAADVLPHIFDPFFTTKADGAGTGLGLANVYAMVRQADGDVIAESEPGGGAGFRVYLPLVPELPTQPRSNPGSPEPEHVARGRGNERILLVEDNEAVRKSMAKLLGALGYQIETARNGVEALARWDALADAGKPAIDMVLTDLAMPKLSGADLAEQLHARDPGLQIVFMSGNLDIVELREQVEQGNARFLQKPVSLRELARMTREVLDAR